MGIGTALRRMAGWETKASPSGVAPGADDAKVDRLWGRLLGYGPSAAGKLVTPDTAMQVSAFWACVKLLSETIATLPLSL